MPDVRVYYMEKQVYATGPCLLGHRDFRTSLFGCCPNSVENRQSITQNFRYLKRGYVNALFSIVLQVGIPLAEPYLVGYMGEYLHLRHLKFGEPGPLQKRNLRHLALHYSMNEFNLIFSSGMEST